jgi:F-type H+-transporting ATPase subunit b
VETEPAEHAIRFAPFDQIDTFPSQIFWLVVTFGVLYFASSNWLLPKIRKLLADRDGVIAADVAAAAAASAKADTAVQELEASIASARARARDTAAKARAEADAKVAAETARQEAELNTRLGASEKRIGEVRTAAMANVAGISKSVADAMVAKLMGKA